MITKKESITISYIRAWAIFSVVCAHISLVPDSFSDRSQLICGILSEIGAIGVGLFFILSGYLMRRKNSSDLNICRFFKKKIESIVIPWFFAAFLLYIYVAVRKGGSVIDGALWILGYKSAYWYLAVLMVLFLIFCLIIKSKNEKKWLLVCMVLSFVSVLLRYMGIIGPTILGVYLNVFNWTIFFAVGYLFAIYRERFIHFLNNRLFVWVVSVISIILIIVPYTTGIDKFSYFCFWYIPAELIISLGIVLLCYRMSVKEKSVLLRVGDWSFSIYIYHELLWAGLIVSVCNKFDSIILLLVRPFIVIIIVYIELQIGKQLFSLIKKEKIYNLLTGIR